MSTLRLATASNVRAFQVLVDALGLSDDKWSQCFDGEALDDEIGRFRVWAGNLGALQKGHSSLDYRLRGSPVLFSSALRLLSELENNLNETHAVVSGARLPYEAQKPTEGAGNDSDDAFSSEEEDEESDSNEPRSELRMRLEEVVDIIDNLYKLSVRIRTPTIRSRSLKASSYTQTDPETGVDILGMYAEQDQKHVRELLSQLRESRSGHDQEDQDFLSERLSSSITLRRRHFKYWKRHRDKLGASTFAEEPSELAVPASHEPPSPVGDDILEAHPSTPVVITPKTTPSQKTGKTLLSGTEATYHHQSLDDIVDTKSVTSYAVTVRDLNGKGIDLPPPPKAAASDKDFECPYCWIVCPARYGKGRAWKTHLLQDLQPYSCTYKDCENSKQLFRSRREWAEHEATHRKLWRCPEHAAALYNSCSGLENHLRQEHIGSFPEDQIAIIAKIGETIAMDTRTNCPICYVPTNTEGLGDLQNHIANHLERFATFALPHGREDDSDGASSVASRGNSNSQSLRDSVHTGASNDVVVPSEDALKLAQSFEFLHVTEPGQLFLSAEILQQLPDESQNRLAMISDQLEGVDDSEDEQPDDQQFDDDILPEHKKHLEEQDAFKQHVLSLPGALSVRFYQRYGSWNGQITFTDDQIGEQAMALFDAQRFPNIEFQSQKNTSKWKFARIFDKNKKDNAPHRQSTVDTQTTEDAEILSSGSELYDKEEEDQEDNKQAIISVAEIPTLRSLYQFRRLLQRDQSFAPNDAYNRMVSLCNYDLTRLRVDAIVSNTTTNIKATPTPDSLHHVIFRAGGSGLRKEARSKARIKVGQVELTHGHALPSSWVIHAAAPTYTGSKGVGQFNVLSECYRSALRMAATHELKTIAFPCLGTGGCNFPPRVAARIALQEVREYLDSHPEHRPERIVFCVRRAIDEKAYTDFLPVFFPPTHGDLDRARTSDWSANRAALATQILEARSKLQKALTDMSDTYDFISWTSTCAHDMGRVDFALTSIGNYLLGPRELNRSLRDLNLLCSVVSTACASLSDIAEQAKEKGFAIEAQYIWGETNSDMHAKYGFDLSTLFGYCWMFANSLDDVITRDMKEPDAMAKARQVLETYDVKQKGQDVEGIRDHLDEVIHMRKSERPAPNNRDVIQVHQIPSVARLYLLGKLEAKPTMAQPSTLFNHAVCLLREDITRVEVDVMVNSTDVSFSGMGTLDRTVFKKGGSELREEVGKIGNCEQGDVKVTPGYLLPARHILHVVPPDQFRKDTKTVLRSIYREILHTAVEMKATSVAIPSIGTGMLNYPRRDCASLAMEEVKRFLESAEPDNGLDKIIFVVFSSNDEFIYKSLLPVYFPPPKGKVPEGPQIEERTPAQDQAAMNIDDHMRREAQREEREPEMRERKPLLPAAVRRILESQEIPSSSEPLATSLAASSDLSTQFELNEEDRLLLQLNDYEDMPWKDIAARFLRDFNKTYQISALQVRLKRLRQRMRVWTDKSRPINKDEEYALFQFESHVDDCDVCSNGLYRTHKLCEQGYPLGQAIMWYMDMSPASNVHGRRDGHILELPAGSMPKSRSLLLTAAQDIGGNPFVQVTRPHEAKPKDQMQRDDSATHPSAAEDANVVASATEPPAVIRAAVLAPQRSGSWVYSLLHVYKSKIKIYLEENYPEEDPYATISLAGTTSSLTRGSTLDYPNAMSLFVERSEKSKGKGKGKGKQKLAESRLTETWHFLGAGASEAAALFAVLQRAVHRNCKTKIETVPPAEREETDSVSTIVPGAQAGSTGETGDTDAYPQWNQRLHDIIKDDLVDEQREKGELDPRLVSYISKDTASSSGGESSEWRQFLTRQKLRVQILDYLADDLKTRPGSYIGQNIDGIASGISIETELAASLLQELAAQGRVHNTVDQNTWVISEQIKEEHVLTQEDKGAAGQERLPPYKNTSSEELMIHSSDDIDTDTLAGRILIHMSRAGPGISAFKLASDPRTTTSSERLAIAKLVDYGFVVSKGTGVDPFLLFLKDFWYICKQECDNASKARTGNPKAKATEQEIRNDASLRWVVAEQEVKQPYLDQASVWSLTELGKERATKMQTKLAKVKQEAALNTEFAKLNEDLSSHLSERTLTHGRSLPGVSENISDLATTFDTPVAELEPVLTQLGSDGPSENKDGSSWTAIIPQEPHSPPTDMSAKDPASARWRRWARNRRSSGNDYKEDAENKEHAARRAGEMGKSMEASSWRDGTGAKQRKQTKSNRALTEDIQENLESGTASRLRLAKIAREKKYNKSSRASVDDIGDELEYYDG